VKRIYQGYLDTMSKRNWWPCLCYATVLTIWQLFPMYMQHHELKLGSYKANSTAEGHRLGKLLVLSMPWRPCTNLFFLLEY